MAPMSPIVLVVEDNDAEREMLSALLAAAGYRVAGAGNGAEALALLPRMPRPHVALLNLRMPMMDGFALLREARSRGLFDGVPVLTLSALPREEHPEDVTARLEKPLAPDALLSAIRKCCGAGARGARRG
jgi:CheY-like chemotaxis protein